MITVAKDSTGDFTSIQAAVDSIKSTPEIIYIKNGIYNDEEHKPVLNVRGRKGVCLPQRVHPLQMLPFGRRFCRDRNDKP